MESSVHFVLLKAQLKVTNTISLDIPEMTNAIATSMKRDLEVVVSGIRHRGQNTGVAGFGFGTGIQERISSIGKCIPVRSSMPNTRDPLPVFNIVFFTEFHILFNLFKCNTHL